MELVTLAIAIAIDFTSPAPQVGRYGHGEKQVMERLEDKHQKARAEKRTVWEHSILGINGHKKSNGQWTTEGPRRFVGSFFDGGSA